MVPGGHAIVAVRGRRLAVEAALPRIPSDPGLVVWTPARAAPVRAAALVALLIAAGVGPNVLYVLANSVWHAPSWGKPLTAVALALAKTACNALLVPHVATAAAVRGSATGRMSLARVRSRAQTLGTFFLLVKRSSGLGAVSASPVCFEVYCEAAAEEQRTQSRAAKSQREKSCRWPSPVVSATDGCRNDGDPTLRLCQSTSGVVIYAPP